MEKTWKLDTSAGEDFRRVAARAKEVAEREGMVVEFDFNGRKCLVNASTDGALLFRDYLNAGMMQWEVVGPDCAVEYAPDVQAELNQKTKEREEQRAVELAAYEEECRIEREKLEQKTASIVLDIIDQTLFDSWKANNTDGYGAAIFEYATGWAKLMQYEMAEGKALADCAKDTSFQLGYLGITGFQYGAAVNILSSCWRHGEALRVWHNGKYKHEGDGVVNPALLTITT